MQQIRLALAALFCAVPFAAACEHETHTHPATPDDLAARETRVEPKAETTGAVRKIVAARCEREERCHNVGPDRTYADHSACTSKLQGSTADDINTKDCDRGVDDVKLHDCIAKIHEEDCGNPIDTLSRVAACRTGAICT
jgi:hypothetical protein